MAEYGCYVKPNRLDPPQDALHAASALEPDMDLHWFLSTSPVNYSRHKDTVIDDLYQKQSRTTDPSERRKYLRAFEKRLSVWLSE